MADNGYLTPLSGCGFALYTTPTTSGVSASTTVGVSGGWVSGGVTSSGGITFNWGDTFSGGRVISGGLYSSGTLLDTPTLLYTCTSSGGEVTYGEINAPAPTGTGADILLSSDGGITIATTLPTDLSDAYQSYLNDKQDALYSGGSCIYAGNSQTFTAGSSYAMLCTGYLMSLNGVRGSLEEGDNGQRYRSNINFLPSVGCWVETDRAVELTAGGASKDVTASVVRVLPGCISCADYNNLFAMEMVLYHAINKVAWRTMRRTGTYTPGLWAQYQGALYRWNAHTYAAQYLDSLEVSEDSFTLKLGWINTTCTEASGFAAWVTIENKGECVTSGGEQTCTAPNPDYRRYQLLYGGVPATYNIGDFSAFIANPDTQTIYYLRGSTPLTSAMLEAAGYPTCTGDPAPQLCSLLSYATIPSLQDFNTDENIGKWVVGLVCNHVAGDGYGGLAVQLGLAQSTADVSVEVSQDAEWTYAVQNHWTTKIGDSSDALDKPDKQFTINGLVTAG